MRPVPAAHGTFVSLSVAATASLPIGAPLRVPVPPTVCCSNKFGPHGVRIWRLLLINGQLEQKQVGRACVQCTHARTHAHMHVCIETPAAGDLLPCRTFKGALLTIRWISCRLSQVADLVMITKEEAREKLYAMLKSG